MKKTIITLFLTLTVVFAIAGCGEEEQKVEKVSFDDKIEIKTDDSDAHFVDVEVPEVQGTDLSALQDIYVDYYKPYRDAGALDYMILRYGDKATFFTGKTVYTGCSIDNSGFPQIKDAEHIYQTGSHDGLLSEMN